VPLIFNYFVLEFSGKQEGAMEEGRSTATTKMVGSKKKYRSRSTSASSQDSLSSGSYSGKKGGSDRAQNCEKSSCINLHPTLLSPVQRSKLHISAAPIVVRILFF
jgi:hypothetical protein